MAISDPNTAGLNESHIRGLLTRWQEIDRLMSEVESVLAAESSGSVFPKYKPELTPVQTRVVRDYIANIRRELLQSATGLGVPLPAPKIGSLHAIRVDLMFAEIAAEECMPEQMRGYGDLSQSAVPQLRGMVEQLKSSIGKLMTYLSEGADFGARLQRLDRTEDEIGLLRRIAEIIDRRGMVEFRPAISAILERLETKAFEIAVFGRVSSGKSSLLNRIIESDVLPVGVTPVTAVPTRVIFGPEPSITVSFAIGRQERLGIDHLGEFVSEEHNRANRKQVTRIVVEIPSARLGEGIVFVDTPGLGSLATAGAAETLAYLPKCDMGVLLVDSGSTLTEEDLGTIRMLLEAGVPTSVLLSKADLIKSADRERATLYTKEKIRERLGIELQVRPVSISPDEERLLESWFEDEIAPLYRRHRELASQSIRRKIGVLRESVESALRMLLRRHGPNRPGAEAVQLAAGKLRHATGAFDETTRECFLALDRFRLAPGRVIQGIAREAVTVQAELDGEWVRATSRRIAADMTRDISDLLAGLALNSTASLIDCAKDLNIAEAPAPGEISQAIQEMPAIDIGSLQVSLHGGALSGIWPRLATHRFEKTLEDQVGPAISHAFAAYASVLQRWLRMTLNDLRERFDAYAENYRAAIVRLEQAGPAPDSGATAGIESDLADLELAEEVTAK